MNKELILDNFEHRDLANYSISHTYVESYDIAITQEKSKYGTSSLQVSYDYSGWKTGNGAMPIKFNSLLQTNDMPVKFGLWVYGQGEVPWLRMTILAGNDERKTINLTFDTMTWYGWKYIDAAIDPHWVLPIQVEQIYAVEVDKRKRENDQFGGIFYIDELRFVYEDDEDLQGPVFTNTFPREELIFHDSFIFQTTVLDHMSGVDPHTIIMKINGHIVNHTYSHETSEVQYTATNLPEGTIHISVSATDFANNLSVPSLDKKYKVDLSPDIEKPIISNITPTEATVVYTKQPRISFHLIDEKSGVHPADIDVTIDGMKQDVYYDETTGWGYALSHEDLSSGKHTFTIDALDRAGNELGQVKETFSIVAMNQPTRDEPFQVAVIPDTHSPSYGKLALTHVAKEHVPFVIHMGDLVDQATAEEFRQVKETIQLLGETPLFTVPGNHESFQGDLHYYREYFGSPTYHVEYGQTLFVFLNTSVNQSITASDSTQFHYLKNLLEQTTRTNIVLITHVPTEDPFDTAHEMNREDAATLELMLTNYKQNHPNKNVAALFGHVHVIYHWEKAGVHYIITGNAARKKYTSHERGSILGYGILQLSSSDIQYTYKPQIQEIAIQIENDWIDEVTLPKGSSARLQVHGKISVLESHYQVNMTPFPMIERQWTSSNQEVVTVNDHGDVRAVEVGEACVSVQVLHKITKITIIVTD